MFYKLLFYCGFVVHNLEIFEDLPPQFENNINEILTINELKPKP